MRTHKHFTTCNGTIATLDVRTIGYAPANYLDVPLPEKNVRMVMASGGGKPALYHYAFGRCESCGQRHFAERRIVRPLQASNHKCSGKCRSASGPNCECACGGANHGAN